EAAAHGADVANGRARLCVGQVGEHPLTHDEIELLFDPPACDVGTLVPVLLARERALLDRAVANTGKVGKKPVPPQTGPGSYVQHRAKLPSVPCDKVGGCARQVGKLRPIVDASFLRLVIALVVGGIERGFGELHREWTPYRSFRPLARPSRKGGDSHAKDL